MTIAWSSLFIDAPPLADRAARRGRRAGYG
jgi:hypothetical protein